MVQKQHGCKLYSADECRKIKTINGKNEIEGLSERYKPNDIDTIYSIEHIGPSRDNSLEQDENTTKLTIKYMAIKGLKNKDVENTINSAISREMVKLYTNAEINNPNIDYINISGNITGNYSNIISIHMIKNTKENGTTLGKRSGKSLNFDLNTGNEIKFEELFLSGVSVKNILTQVIYDNLSKQNNSKNIEDKVYDIINKYEQGKLDDFYFDSNIVYFAIEGNWYTLPMWRYYEKIGIYKRFKTANSIFDGTHKKTGESFVFQEIKEELVNQKISDNFIAIIVTPYNLKNKSEYFIKKFNEYYDEVRSKVQKLKKVADVEPEQTIIYACKIDINNIDNYWSYSATDEQGINTVKSTNFLDEYEICETGRNECIIRISNDYFEDELLQKMYKRGFAVEKFASMSKEELFSLVGNKAKMENSSDDKAIVELVTNKPIEEAIENQFKKKADEIEELLKKATLEDLSSIETKVNELKENVGILEGKFANQENEKIKSIDENYKQRIENFDKSIFNVKLKNEIIETFESQIKELNTGKSEYNIDEVEESTYYLSQILNTYYSKNKNNDRDINSLLSDYSRDLVNIQDWAIKLRQKQLEEEEKKKQNEIGNNTSGIILDLNNTNNSNTTNNINNTNTTNSTNTINNSNTTNSNRANSINNSATNFIENTTNSINKIDE